MKPELIVMLTYNDRTAENAIELFDDLKSLPITHWGFKNVGITNEEMKRLVDKMKAAGKIICLEGVTLSEEEGFATAKLAVEHGFDILMGTAFFDSIKAYLKNQTIKYYPFPGHIHGHPNILDGTQQQIVQDALSLEAKGVDGLDLLTYRYTGNPETLLKKVVEAVKTVPIVSAGSIDAYERITKICDIGVWGFTIGTAFFEKKFAPQGSFKDNVMAAWRWLNKKTSENN